MKNFVIFGCGMISNIHAKAVESLENAKLLGCCDVNVEAAKTFSEKYGIKCYENIDEILNDKNVDIVCICTPSGTHAELAIKFLNAGINVVVEKPMAINTKDCERIIEASEKNGAKIMVVSQLRTSPDIKRAREIVQTGKLGKLVLCDLYMKYYRSEDYYKGSWRGTLKMDGGGALMNQGIHGVDLLQYIVGPVKNIKSIVKTLVHNIEVEDTAVSAVEFENGALGVIEATTAVNPSFDREMKVHGTKGYMYICDNCIEKLVVDGEEQPCEKYNSLGSSSDPTAVQYFEHAKQFSAFIDVINGQDIEYVSGYEGIKAVDIIERIYSDR